MTNNCIEETHGRLAYVASLILYKFTEGREDWSEFIALRDALEESTSYLNCDNFILHGVKRRLTEFDKRITKEKMHKDVKWDYENRIKNWIDKIGAMCNLDSSSKEEIQGTNELVRERIEELLRYIEPREEAQTEYEYRIESLLDDIDYRCSTDFEKAGNKRDIQNTIFLVGERTKDLLENVTPGQNGF